MSVHRIHPHVINNDNNRSNNNNNIFNNLNNLFDSNNERSTSNFSTNGQQINSAQFRGIIKLIIHILRGFLHVSQLSDEATQDHPQHKSIFKRIANHFKK